MCYPETLSTRMPGLLLQTFLPMLLNHKGAFHGPGWINRILWSTKLLFMAVLASIVDCIGYIRSYIRS